MRYEQNLYLVLFLSYKTSNFLDFCLYFTHLDDVIMTSYFRLDIFSYSLRHPPIDYLSDLLSTTAVSIMVLEI